MGTYRRRRASISSPRPLVAFLLIASFGILFVGCGGTPADTEVEDEFTFTADDVARFRELTQQAEEMEGVPTADGPSLLDEEGMAEPPVLDLSLVSSYNAIRSGSEAAENNSYRVINEFLNVRSAPEVTAEVVERLDRGALVKVLDFADAAWAHIALSGQREGYVAQRYIAKLTSEEKLAEEKEKFKDVFFIDFGFLNVRKEPDTNSEKIGELPGQSFVTILSKNEVWARIPFDGGEGYVAVEYLSPFLPNFLVRQDEFTLPILHYRLGSEEMLGALASHADGLLKSGYTIIPLREFHDLLLEQEERDVRLDPKRVVIAISNITPENVKEVSDVLRASGIRATLFLETKHIGINGITEKTILTLLANGHDLQSAGHTGDDLRSLTNTQVELELKQSRQILEQYTKKQVFAIAYPLGGVNSRIEEKAQEAGYLLGIGSAQERMFHRDQFLSLPAFVLSSSASADEVVGLVSGE